MGHLLTTFNGFKIFTKIDLCGAYYLVQIAEGCEYLMTFNTHMVLSKIESCLLV